MTIRTTCPNCHTNFDLVGDPRQELVDKILDLWNQKDGWPTSAGWIPGAAYQELAEVLGVDVDRLYHWDPETKTHHDPLEGTRT